MLNVAHIIQQQFGKADFAPTEFTDSRRFFFRQIFYHITAFIPAVLEIIEQFGFCISSFGNNARRIEFIERERRGRREIFNCAGQIKSSQKSACETIYQ